jgi:membrane protein implicated in regulation of membrane protease activity
VTGSEAAFIVVGAVGLVLLALSFLFGEMFGHDAELSHEVEAGHEVESDTADAASNMLQTPSWLSFKTLTASMVGFGAFGYVAAASGLPALLSWPVAGVGFFAIGAGAFFLVIKPLARQQSNSLQSHHGYVGCEGVLSLEIPEGGSGQVTFRDRQGARVTRQAISSKGEALAKGAQVLIIDIAGNGAVVVYHNPLELEA